MIFQFSISDLATLLGKSPVTIRSWERKGLLRVPRVGLNRVLTTIQVNEVATEAYNLDRITAERLDLITGAMAILSIIEQENP